MKVHPLPLLILLIGGLVLAKAKEPGTADGSKLKGYDPEGGGGKRILEVPVEGTIDLGLAPFVSRAIEEAGSMDVVVLRIDTFGGRVDAAVRIRDALLASKAPTIAFINRRAISAGALISIACDTIIMSPGGTIGAATPVQQGDGGEMKETSEKVVSYMRAEMRATAEAKGRRADIAAAMVDRDIEVKDVIEKGKLLTLTTEEATEIGFAEGKAATMEDLVALLNLGNAARSAYRADWGEQVARWLTDPMVSSLLMTFGFLGVLMELYSPGFGVGGIIGAACLALFFFGQYAAKLAGIEEFLLFGLGVGLLLLEVLVIPGFGIAGIMGMVLMLVSMVMAMMELNVPLEVSFELGYFQEAVWSATVRLAVTIVLLTIGAAVLAKYFPGSSIGERIILRMATRASNGYVSVEASYDHLLGQSGVAVTVLRPQGTAEFTGRRVDVASDGDFIEKGEAVEVVKVDGTRVVVKQTGDIEA